MFVADPAASAPPVIFALSNGTATIYARARDVNPALWERTFGHSHKDFAYYQLIEDTMTVGFTYRYLVLSDHEQRDRALQPLIRVDQDLTASLGNFARRKVEQFRRLWPRFLSARILMAGCLVGDGALGVVEENAATWSAAVLAEALMVYAKHERVSLITIKDYPASFRAMLQPAFGKTYARLDGFPSLTMELPFESFEAYLERKLSRITRKGLRRKLRKSAEATPPVKLEVLSDCSEVIDEIYPLYAEVARRGAITFEVFTKEYFVEAGLRLPERCRFFIWRQSGKAVAFSFCTLWEGTIYDNDIGLDYGVAHELNLYYLTFRDIMEWALQHGYRRYCTAPFNYEPKLRLKLELVPLDIYVRHTSALANWFVRRFAPAFSPARSDPVLRKTNAEAT